MTKANTDKDKQWQRQTMTKTNNDNGKQWQRPTRSVIKRLQEKKLQEMSPAWSIRALMKTKKLLSTWEWRQRLLSLQDFHTVFKNHSFIQPISAPDFPSLKTHYHVNLQMSKLPHTYSSHNKRNFYYVNNKGINLLQVVSVEATPENSICSYSWTVAV